MGSQRHYTLYMTLVSIITPSYNQAAYIEQTIQSVLEQDYPHIEYIVVDGGSTDNSAEIIQKYADRLAYWISERDSGQAEAINKGFARANGEIVAWLNSDDYYMLNTISFVVRCFEQNPDVVMVYGDMLAVDGDGQTINVLKYKQLSLEDLLCFQIIGQPSVFFRRSALEKTGLLEPSFHFMLDHHLWIRLARQGRILHVPQVWSAARYHADAKNRARAAEFGREAFRVLEWARKQSGLVECRFKGKATRPRLRPPLRRALSARWGTECICIGGMVPCSLSPSAHSPGAFKHLNFRISQPDRFEPSA